MEISVVIPARNAAATLAETLASLRAQTFSTWEALVVDDGSTDRTAEIACEAGAADPRIRLLSGPGEGPGAARNAGIAQARADWLLFLDADDAIEPTHLERMAGALNDGEMDGAICGWTRMMPDGRRGPACLPEGGDLFDRLARYCAFAIHACVVRRARVEEVGGFDPSLLTCEEWDLWQRLARAGARFAQVPEVLALYRLRPGSTSHDPRRLLEDGLRVIARGHAPDPRVPRPDPAHAGGRPLREQAAARLLFSCWAAGLAAGRGEDARPLLAALDGDRDPGLDPCAAARSLFQAALLPLGGMPASWLEPWPEVEARLAAFLEGLEETAGARHLTALAQRETERLALEHAGGSRPLTLGRTRAVRIELTRPIADLQVPAPAERLNISATLEGEEIGTVELPVAGGTAPARLLADALADRFAWTVLGRFFARQGKGPFGWELFLQEVWGRPDWPLARFYDPAGAQEEAPLVRPRGGRIEVEASGEIPALELTGPADAMLRVGGATIGRVRLLRSEGRMGAHELRAFLTGVSGFELCRAAVREALLGQPLDAPGTLRERLAEAARRQTPNGSVDLRGAVLARHPRAPLASPASRRAFLPAEALPDLLDLARVTGQSVILPPAGPAPLWAEYAPDLFAEPAPPRIEEASPGPLPPEVRTWRLPILLYHRIAPEGSEATARYRITPEAFAEQLRYLRDSGYHTPRVADWLRAQEAKEPLPGRAVLITFDDGYHDFAEHAWPLLREHGFSALVFLVAEAVGGTNGWDEAYGEPLPLLGWDEIRRLQTRGIQFGSHAASHRPLTALSPAEAVRELARSRALLTRGLSAPPEAVAYPHGATDAVVQHLAGACGYLCGLTYQPVRSGFDDPPLALPRLEVRGDASFADFVALLEGS
jgi:peptidoglycan/xylan/chitin deacetylase (PgdA/CDA1 family)/GT2 family glycosyltransferase